MMKHLIMVIICFMITACGLDPDAKYTAGKTLWDKTGCAFIVKKNIGDNVFVDFNQDLSKETCKYKKEDY